MHFQYAIKSSHVYGNPYRIGFEAARCKRERDKILKVLIYEQMLAYCTFMFRMSEIEFTFRQSPIGQVAFTAWEEIYLANASRALQALNYLRDVRNFLDLIIENLSL